MTKSEPTKTDTDASAQAAEPGRAPAKADVPRATEPTGQHAAATGEDDLMQLRQELAATKERMLRAQADLDNLRKRSRRELEESARYANLPLMRDLLPVVDDVSRAIEAAEKTQEAAGLLEGFKMVARQLESVLERHQCRRIAALHEPFDPNRHEAVLQQPDEESLPNTIIAVLRAGFELHDRVVRPSQVIVSSGKASAENENGPNPPDD